MEHRGSCHCCRKCPNCYFFTLLFCIISLLLLLFFQLYAWFHNQKSLSAKGCILQWPTLYPSPSIVLLFQPWKYLMILKMVTVCIIHIIAIIAIMCMNVNYDNYAYYSHYLNYIWLISCRMVGVCCFSCGIRAWLQETYPLRWSHSEYLGQTSLGACRWHQYSMSNAFSGAPGDRRPGAGDGCRMWFVNSRALGWSRDL
jgi:hypothetical protein